MKSIFSREKIQVEWVRVEWVELVLLFKSSESEYLKLELDSSSYIELDRSRKLTWFASRMSLTSLSSRSLLRKFSGMEPNMSSSSQLVRKWVPKQARVRLI